MRSILFTLPIVLWVVAASWALDPAVKCEADKLKWAGHYNLCCMKAESNALKRSIPPDFSVCDHKFLHHWQKAESKAAGACSTIGDAGDVRAQVAADSGALALRLTGERFIDNGDGTVRDTQTGLMWEKKVEGSGCLHCVDDRYAWMEAMSEWLSEVNGFWTSWTQQAGLGGHSDWRIPTIVELQTILDCEAGPSCIDPVFGPTAASYWSSSTLATSPIFTWNAVFSDGSLAIVAKILPYHAVRAVRAG